MSSVDDELRKRLELLKGKTSLSSSDKPSTSGILPVTPKKTAAEQVENLLAQLSEENTIEKKVNKTELDKDLALRCRLERLKSREDCEFVPSKKVSSTNNDSDHSDDVADEDYFNNSSCKDLVTDLEHTSDKDSLSDESDVSEELCTFCDEQKPVIVCVDCDKDLYCKKCFKEYHYAEEKHKTMPYLKKS